ncbi:MAG TPA: uracil phosphoribosyltransferase [Pyrinomonadaceae bacterium]|nr:uracil phosphoribosyltransferase [Pyrinomonadaceae bacterium]
MCHRCDALLFDFARASGVYEGALRESVLLLKRQPNLSATLIELLVAAALRSPLDTATRIVPVPLHPEREQRRGFNQAAIIAHAIASKLGLVVDEQSLVRVVASEKYRAGLDSTGRHQTVTDAFVVRLPQLIAQETVLLIDDVLTTGATASSCAAALLRAGAKSVQVLTIARPG